MKKVLSYAGMLCLLAILLFASCKKDDAGSQGTTGLQGGTGAQGPQGPQGPQGTQGAAGNANVTTHTFGITDLFHNDDIDFTIHTTQDTMNNSAWFAYVFDPFIKKWWAVPGYEAFSGTTYWMNYGYDEINNWVKVTVGKSTGPGYNYSKAKIVRIYSSNTVPGRASAHSSELSVLPDIDFTDYEMVKAYYHLPE